MEKQEAYQIISDLIRKGFLTLNVTIGDKNLVFKTVSDREYDLIKLHSGSSQNKSEYTLKFNTNFVAYSMLIIDGIFILNKRQEYYKDILKLINSLPSSLYNALLKEIVALKNKVQEASTYLEGFCYTSYSRRLWNILRNGNPNDDNLTGIEGTGKLGLNTFQENWISINKMMDSDDDYNKYFSLALLIASATNPKGCKSAKAKHNANVQQVEEKRKKLAVEGFIAKPKWTPDGWAAPVDTAEELIAELMRQMKGEKDKHDLFIEDYIHTLEKENEERKKAEEDRLNEFKKKREGEPTITGSQTVLSREEAEVLFGRKSNNLSIVRSDEIADENQQNRFYNKIGRKVITGK